MIYFLQNECPGKFIKIGFSANPSKLHKQQDSYNPYRTVLLAVMHGFWKEEKELHYKFSYARYDREWFYPVPELMELIRNCTLPLDATAQTVQLQERQFT